MFKDDAKHNRWANSRAMEFAGITDATVGPDGGKIMRDAEGRATGVLLEAAGVIVEQARESLSPTPTSQVAEAAARGMEMLHSYGITGFQDAAASLQLMQALKELDESGNLHAWVVTSMQVNDFIFGTHPLGEGSLPSASKPGPPTTALISSRSSSMASRRPVPDRSSNRIWKAWVSRSAIAAARPCFQKNSRAG